LAVAACVLRSSALATLLLLLTATQPPLAAAAAAAGSATTPSSSSSSSARAPLSRARAAAPREGARSAPPFIPRVSGIYRGEVAGADTGAGTSVPSSEFSALWDLYASTNGPRWVWRNESAAGLVWPLAGVARNSSSLNMSALPSPCCWQAIACSCPQAQRSATAYHPFNYAYYNYFYDDDMAAPTNETTAVCHVEKLFLIGFGLSGKLPSSLFRDLPYLTHLHLARNSLTGPLPLDNRTNLTHLTLLDVASNFITGTSLLRDSRYYLLPFNM